MSFCSQPAAIASAAVDQQIQIAVAKEQLDGQRMQGDAALALLEAAANLSKALGKGERLDAVA